MLVNNNISPLCFYDDINLQNHRKSYSFGSVYPLVIFRNTLLPFQIIISRGSDIGLSSIDGFFLYSLDGSVNGVDITRSISEGGLQAIYRDGFTVFKYKGNFQIPEIKYEGQYYIKLVIDEADLGITLYSEVFTVKNNVDDFLCLEYSNPYNFVFNGGEIDFSDNFKFKCYLPTLIGKPEYDFEEEVVERMGYSFMKSQVSKKVYKFTVIAPEYLCDALRIVRLCADKTIISDGRHYDLTNFTMEVEWEEQGNLAAVECSFETDTVISNIGGYRQEPLGGSFDKSFSNSFEGQIEEINANSPNLKDEDITEPSINNEDSINNELTTP